jgi:hypothetical protein
MHGKKTMAALILTGASPLLGSALSTSIWGYLDPGTGSMLFQIMIAGLLSSMFFAKNSYHLVRSRLQDFARKSRA